MPAHPAFCNTVCAVEVSLCLFCRHYWVLAYWQHLTDFGFLLTTSPATYMELSLSWEISNCWTAEEISYRLWNPYVTHCTHKIPQLVFTKVHISKVNILVSYLFKFIFNIIVLFVCKFQELLYFQVLLTTLFCAFLIAHMRSMMHQFCSLWFDNTNGIWLHHSNKFSSTGKIIFWSLQKVLLPNKLIFILFNCFGGMVRILNSVSMFHVKM